MITVLSALALAYVLLCLWAHFFAPVGTRSVLYGYHCVLIHWMFVARGWWSLYKWERVDIGASVLEGPFGARVWRTVHASLRSPQLWIAFVIHDLGYWGKPNMDGAEGERHPEWACKKMNQWFGAPWGTFSLYHSRFYAKQYGAQPSPLCYADKLAIVVMPDWLYLPLIRATGEVHEYMKNVKASFGDAGKEEHPDARAWLHDVKDYVTKWVEEHKDGRADTWTKVGGNREPLFGKDTGVWQ